MIFIFSLTFLIGSVLLQPYIGLKTPDMLYIIILCSINLIFTPYYIIESIRLDKVFKLEDHHIVAFGKRIGIVSCVYAVHFFVFLSLFFIGLHDLEVMMAGIITFMELMLLGICFKEYYDLVLLNETERKLDLDLNRRRYIGRKSTIDLKE